MRVTSSLQAQTLAVERAATNLRGHIRTLRDLAEKGRRPAHEVDIAERFYVDLHAAALMLRKHCDRQAAITAASEGLE